MQSFKWLDRPWIIELGLVIVLLLCIHLVLKKVILRGKKIEGDWRFHLDYAVAVPMGVLLWILFIAFGIDLMVREFKLMGFAYVIPLRNAAIIVCLAWFFLRWKKVFYQVMVKKIDRPGGERLRLDSFTMEMTSKLLTIVILFMTVLIVMSIFGFNIAPLVTFGGVGAAILGISGKDVIANFFGGFMIYLTRPFRIGDRIDLPGKKLGGVVEEIGWYFTSVRDDQKKPFYVPNAVFSVEPVINLSRITHRRIEESIGVRYEDVDRVPGIVQSIRTLFEEHTGIDHALPVHVFMEAFGQTAIQIEIKVYLSSTRYEEFMEMRTELMRKIYEIIQESGAQIPYPTMAVKLEQ